MFRNYRFKSLNILLVVFVMALTIIGIFVIGSANEDYQTKQIMGMAGGLVAMAVVSLVDYNFLIKFKWVYYVLMVAILLMVLFFGKTVAGATRRCFWYCFLRDFLWSMRRISIPGRSWR